jgi:hypothetical protein
MRPRCELRRHPSISNLGAALAPVLALALACAFGVGDAAAAGGSGAAQELAARYAPIVVLKDQRRPCDTHGEAYEPVPVGVVLGRSDVTLRGPDGFALAAPTARQLYGKDGRYFLDFPGNPLKPGCTYERWSREISKGKPATVYAHVATEPGKPGLLALQYWLYYVYNDWNNKHEGDWEMLQLVFAADSAELALHRRPIEVGYSQHSGAERAGWSGPTLQREGTHPLVYAAAGSHAQFYSSELWFGYSAQAGVGCDDTRGPSHELEPKVVLLPDAASAANAPFAWLGFEGLWGQRLRSPNGGPTGPSVKRQWTHPITWSQTTWRDSALSVPGGRSLGPNATGFFCGAVAAGSKVYLHTLASPVVSIAVLAALAAVAIVLVRRTRWSAADPLQVEHRRAAGEMFVSAWRIHAAHRRMFLAVGAVFVPLGVIAAAQQTILFAHTPFTDPRGIEGSDRVVSGVAALMVGSGITALIPSVLVAAAVAMAVNELAHDRPARVHLREFAGRLVPLAVSTLVIVVVVALLATTVVGLVVAIAFLVWHSVTAQACVIERRSALDALGRSRRLVRHHSWRVLAITATANGVGLALGPIVGLTVLFASSASLGAIDIVSSIVYAVVMPYVAIVLALLFYDLRTSAGPEPAGAGSPGPGAAEPDR